MDSSPAWAFGDVGSVSIAPCMPAWPRGSSISSRRNSPPCLRSHFSFSAIVRPGTDGPPLTIRRTASPATSASIVLMRVIKKKGAAGSRALQL